MKKKPAKIKRRVFRGWMNIDRELPQKTEQLTQMRWGNSQWFSGEGGERRVKITVEWKEP